MRYRTAGFVLAAQLVTTGLIASALAPTGNAAGAAPGVEVAAAAKAKPKGSVLLRPAIGQSKSGKTVLRPGIARFSPAKKGRTVKVQQKKSGSWKTIASGKQNARGEFAFLIPLGSSSPRIRATSQYSGKAVNSPTVSSSPWKLVWSDNFNGTSLSSAWTVLPTSAAAKRTCATVTPEMSTVAGGVLNLKVQKNPANPAPAASCPDGQFLNAQIGTPTKTFTYGVFAARIKFQAARGMHSAFWMFPAGPDPVNVPASDLPGRMGTEIDVLEYFGDGQSDYAAYRSWVYWPKMVNGEVVQQRSGARPKISAIKGKKDLSAAWHVVSVEWTSKGYIYRFDGVEFQRITQGISRRPEQILLSMLTSDYEIPRMTKNSVPAVMKVDWVRAWQR